MSCPFLGIDDDLGELAMASPPRLRARPPSTQQTQRAGAMKRMRSPSIRTTPAISAASSRARGSLPRTSSTSEIRGDEAAAATRSASIVADGRPGQVLRDEAGKRVRHRQGLARARARVDQCPREFQRVERVATENRSIFSRAGRCNDSPNCSRTMWKRLATLRPSSRTCVRSAERECSRVEATPASSAPVRRTRKNPTGLDPSLLAANPSAAADGRSSHCTSSTATRTGVCSASRTRSVANAVPIAR